MAASFNVLHFILFSGNIPNEPGMQLFNMVLPPLSIEVYYKREEFTTKGAYSFLFNANPFSGDQERILETAFGKMAEYISNV